ncbi:PAS domain-containing protein [Proteobacteria bacterium 005FR1]|nr:PAS domain-containing protein [Proteobacteria bacterium 005FR1]
MGQTEKAVPLVHFVTNHQGGDNQQTVDLAATMRSRGFRVVFFADASELLASPTTADKPALILFDITTAPEQVEMLRDLQAGDVPVVLITDRDDLELRLAAMRAGAKRYVCRPFADDYFLEVIESLTDLSPDQPYRVLLLDCDPRSLEAQATVLRGAGMSVRALSQPMQVLDAIDDFEPDIILLDLQMPCVSGPELAAVLRERDSQLDVPILFFTGGLSESAQQRAIDLGGDGFLDRPGEPDRFVTAVAARVRRARRSKLDRQRLERTLREREHEHRALDHHAIVSVADNRGNIIQANDLFCMTSGYTRNELIGRNHRILKSGIHRPEFYRELWDTISRGVTWQGEICNRRKDGTLYWVASTITPFLDASGEPYQYVSIRTDITEAKQREAALQVLVESTKPIGGQSFYEHAAAGLARATGCRAGFIAVAAPGSPENFWTLALWDNNQLHPNYGYSAKGSPCEGVLSGEIVIIDQGVAERFPGNSWLADNGMQGFIAVPFYDSRGNLTGQMGVVDDKPLARRRSMLALLQAFASRIAAEQERQRAEEATQHHRERLRRGQMFANIGTWEWNIQDGQLYWSERIAPLFGYIEGEVETSYENFLVAVHPDDRQAVIDAVEACIERDQPYDIEHRVVWQNGTVRWLLERGAVIRDEFGQPLQMLGVVQDIDDRKRAELALAESERQLRQAQSIAHIGSWQANLITGELIWSGEVFRIFGYEPGSITPSVEAFRQAVHPDDHELVRKSEEGALRTGSHDVVHRIILPDGRIRYVHELGQPEYDSEGRMEKLSGVIQDVTSRVEAQQSMVAARDEAERANQAKSEFLSSMSHELRTPMNAIIGFSQLLEADDELSEDQCENVGEILKASNHLLKLINEVLDLAKVESGRIELSLEPVEVRPIVEECVSLLSVVADKRQVRIVPGEFSGLLVRADRTRFRQILLNLLSNAIKYNREGGSVRLLLADPNGGRLRIGVSDDGFGIAADKIEALFEPFNRLDAEGGDIEGSGIGLTLSRRLAEMMGGTIEVESTLGEGSTFWIELPAESLSIEDDCELSASTPLATVRRSMRKNLILYIEDNPANLRLVNKILGRRDDIELITAHTSGLGIELAAAKKPDLILLDINLPGLNGYQVMNVLRANPDLCEVPVVAITANAMPRDLERGKKAGFVDYLTKPLDVDRFTSAISSVLDREK